MLAVAVVLLSLTLLFSCATSRNTNKANDNKPQADSVDVFTPTHPPVVVPHSWRENRNNDMSTADVK